ncbi:hypothetical protein P3S67_015746 [Capsicum chacoense]
MKITMCHFEIDITDTNSKTSTTNSEMFKQRILSSGVVQMSADQKKATILGSQQRKCQYSVETTSTINLRRRELYQKLSPDKKEALLLCQRSKKLESRRQREGASCSQAGVDLHRQTSLTICEPYFVATTANISSIHATKLVFGKEKTIIEYFTVFEVGSTSIVPHQQHDSRVLAITNKASNRSFGDDTMLRSVLKNVVTNHSSIFELGSTSTPPHEQPDMEILATTNIEYYKIGLKIHTAINFIYLIQEWKVNDMCMTLSLFSKNKEEKELRVSVNITDDFLLES